jgi:hypothetical protein
MMTPNHPIHADACKRCAVVLALVVGTRWAAE